MKNLFRKVSLVSTAAIAFAVAPSVMAMPVPDEMLFDINSLGGVPSTLAKGFTGTLNLVSNSGTQLQDFRITTNPGGIVTHPVLTGSMSSASASINFSSGFVTGGAIVIVYNNGDSTTTTYKADLIPHSVSGIGELQTQSAAQGTLQFSADTENGQFSQNSIGGYDISPWFNAQSFPGNHLFGNVITFAISPRNGTADTDIAVLVPLPSSVLMGTASLAGLGLLRAFRRRKLA